MNSKISTSSKIYAESLVQTSTDYDAVLKDLKNVVEVIKSSDDLSKLTENPAISTNKKFEIIDEVFKNIVSDKMINFLKILIDKNKFSDLEQIFEAYSDLVDKLKGIKRVEIISATDLSEDWKNKILEKLQAKFNKSISAVWTKDENIISGLIIKSDDEVIDTSIRNRLYRISKI